MLRVGIIGCGKIADAHVQQVRAVGRAQIVGVCDSHPDMARQLCERWRIPRAYPDLRCLIRDGRLDVVHVATPPESHAEIACEALASGCHVFVEKPFTINEDEATAVLECARLANRRVSSNYFFNFSRPSLALRRLISSGNLGDVVHVDAAFGYDLTSGYGVAALSDPEHWVHRLPGKLFHNLLDHVVANVVDYLGDDVRAQAIAFRRRSSVESPTLDALGDELRFQVRAGNVTFSGWVSAHARPRVHTVRIAGTGDSVELDQIAQTVVRVPRQIHRSAIGVLLAPWSHAWQLAGHGWRNLRAFSRHELHYFQGMRVLLERFYDAVEYGTPDPISSQQILRTCRVVEAIVECVREPDAASDHGRWRLPGVAGRLEPAGQRVSSPQAALS